MKNWPIQQYRKPQVPLYFRVPNMTKQKYENSSCSVKLVRSQSDFVVARFEARLRPVWGSAKESFLD